jgi:hypothetical protein
MLAVAKAEHVDVVHTYGATSRWNVSHGTAEHVIVRAGKRPFLNGYIVDEVHGLDVHARIRKGGEPTAEERGAGRLSHALDPARRLEDDIVRKDLGKSVDVVGVEGIGSPFKGLARSHCHWILPRIVQYGPKGRAGKNPSLEGWHPGFFSVEEFRQLVAPLDAELGVRTGEVALDGFERHVQLVGDFSVGPARGRQLYDTQLPGA